MSYCIWKLSEYTIRKRRNNRTLNKLNMTLLCIFWFLFSAFQTGLCSICCYLLHFWKVPLYVLIEIRNNNPLWSRDLNWLKDSWFLTFFGLKWHPGSELFLSSRFLPIATVYPKKKHFSGALQWILVSNSLWYTHMHTHVFIWCPPPQSSLPPETSSWISHLCL